MHFLDRFPFPLVAILRGLPPGDALRVAGVLFRAGFHLLEVPLNRPGALEAIAAVAAIAPPDALVGGGTVLSIADVDAVHAAGGRMIVSPNCDPRVIAHSVERRMLSLPGVATPSEAFVALASGADGLKLFPAEAMTPPVVKALRSVLPERTALLPVGSIHPGNMGSFIAAGADGFGIGSQLYAPGIETVRLEVAARTFMSTRSAILQTAA